MTNEGRDDRMGDDNGQQLLDSLRSLEEYYDRSMHRLLPLAFLISVFSLFGISWIVVAVDPDTAPWYIFVILTVLIFLFVFNFLGTLLYFLRTKFIKNYDRRWYVKTSFKMAFFIAIFVALLAALSILQLVTTLTLFASITIVGLLAVWLYLGRK